MSAATPLHPKLCSGLLPAPHLSSHVSESGSPPSFPCATQTWGKEEYGQAQPPASPPKHEMMELGPMGGRFGVCCSLEVWTGDFAKHAVRGTPSEDKTAPARATEL